MEKFNFEEIKNFIKKVGKTILKVIKSFVLPIVLIIAIITVLLAGFVYLITLDDGSRKEGDISNAPYAASTYTQSVTIDENGNITTNMTAQALWDEMIEILVQWGVQEDELYQLEELLRLGDIKQRCYF